MQRVERKRKMTQWLVGSLPSDSIFFFVIEIYGRCASEAGNFPLKPPLSKIESEMCFLDSLYSRPNGMAFLQSSERTAVYFIIYYRKKKKFFTSNVTITYGI